LRKIPAADRPRGFVCEPTIFAVADPHRVMPAYRATGKNESGFLWDKRLRRSGTSHFKLLPIVHDLFAKPLTLWRIMR
jgi:hypothetical protein